MTTDITQAAALRYEHVRRLIRERVSQGDLVEFGAAPGDQLIAFAQAGYTCTAVDIGVASDAWAGAEDGRMMRLFREHEIDYLEWNLEEAPYPLDSDAFDVVVMTEVFEHLRDYPIRSLQEAYRVLRPGGTLAFTTPNAAYLGNRLKLLRGRSPATPLSDWIGGIPHARHAREYTFAEISELMDRVGFRVDRCESPHFFRAEGTTWRRAAKKGIEAIARLRPPLGPSIVVFASKPDDADRRV